ncbi:MAG TPA: DUF892 family protein [Gemmata sp.]
MNCCLAARASVARATGLKGAFTEHLAAPRTQVGRPEPLLTALAVGPKGKKCEAAEGLIEEGKEAPEEAGARP